MHGVNGRRITMATGATQQGKQGIRVAPEGFVLWEYIGPAATVRECHAHLAHAPLAGRYFVHPHAHLPHAPLAVVPASIFLDQILF